MPVFHVPMPFCPQYHTTFYITGFFSGHVAAAAAAAAKSLQSCPTLSDPMDCSPPGSSIHGIFQARALERGAIAFSRGHVNQPQKQYL